MTTIRVNVPDYLATLAAEAAVRERTTLDQIVSLALSALLSAWKIRDDMEARAARCTAEHLDNILAKVPGVPPVPGDEL